MNSNFIVCSGEHSKDYLYYSEESKMNMLNAVINLCIVCIGNTKERLNKFFGGGVKMTLSHQAEKWLMGEVFHIPIGHHFHLK